MSLKRDSANLLIVQGVVDYYDLDATTKAPAPVVGATVTAQIYALDRITLIGSEVILTAEADQAPNTYRGISPATVDLSAHDEVAIKYVVNAGGDWSRSTSWVEEAVVDA